MECDDKQFCGGGSFYELEHYPVVLCVAEGFVRGVEGGWREGISALHSVVTKEQG